jgi:sodium/proline symporter
MTSEHLTIGFTFLVYLAVLLYIGWRGYRNTSDLPDFVLGGRRLGSWVAALSAGASDMSGWLLLGLPGYAYLAGLEAFWLALGLLLGTWLNWRLQAPRLRVFSERAGNSLTLPEFFANRFHDASGVLRGVCALFILLFFLFYTSSMLVSGGKLFEAVFGVPYHWAVLLGAVAIILYTSIGGFLAVSWSDLVQALLMAGALLVVPALAFAQSGGGPGLAGLERLEPQLLDIFTDRSGEPLSAIAIASLLGWGLGYFGQPHILARFQATRSTRQIPAARRIAVSWAALTLTAAILVGLAGIPYFDPPLADPETVFIELVNLLFHPLIGGICLAAVLAAIMSTADSQLLVASSTLTEDFYRTLLRRQAGSRELVLVGRTAVLLLAVIAVALALDPESSVLALVAYAWAGLGAAFGPTLLLSLYWSRMTRSGALAGIVGGGLTVVVWKQLEGGLFELYEIVPGVLVSLLAIISVSLLSPPPDRKLVAEFHEMESAD